MMRILGIGDLHLESPLKRLIPDYNELVLQSVDRAVRQGIKKGIDLCILYGDVCHYPGKDTLSDDSLQGLIALFLKHADVQFLVLEGNHDRRSDGDSSLTFLQSLGVGGSVASVQNMSVITSPKDFKDTKIRMVPYPHTETREGWLNVLHHDCKGSKMDSGREVTEGFTTKNFCVAGHLHTAQRVKNIHFSGTLHQTTFGEQPDKFYHLIDWEGDVESAVVKLVPFQAPYRLENVVIKSDAEYEEFLVNYKAAEKGAYPTVYFKVFVDRRVILPVDPFGKCPHVLKTNSFASARELKSAMADELSLELGDIEADHFHVRSVMDDWMVTHDVPPDLQKRVRATIENFQSA